jgi:hypothetical protein
MLTQMVVKMITAKMSGTKSTASHPMTGLVSGITTIAAAVDAMASNATSVRRFT